MIIWCFWSMFISVCDLIILIFFHVFFNKSSNFLHDKYNFWFSNALNFFSDDIFFRRRKIEAYSWFKFVISQKWENMNNCENWCIENIFYYEQSINLIILLMIYIRAQIFFHFLIENFALIIRFRMKCDEKFCFNSQHFANDISYQ